jgi:hypothetical protein
MSTNPEQFVRIIPDALPPGARWRPTVGTETLELLDHLRMTGESAERLQNEAAGILAKCVPPLPMTEHATGLVLGYVQSGKTMSFTTVAALARDNGFRMVIVITGVSKPLFVQSETRLKNDLRLQTRPDRKWQHYSNPHANDSERRSITDTLADWDDLSVPEQERRTVLVTVMKNHAHLNNLIQLLNLLPLNNVPVLIIDDEADQAGLNTQVNQGMQSPTYVRLQALRAAVPHHTFLQYTATPQAPLLINLIDVLSPRFAELLTPGPAYVGGRQFFVEQPNLVETIPVNDIPTAQNRLNAPPDSLLQAMRLFFLGVAAGLVQNRGRGNRSMLVHPSLSRTGHRQYTHWVTAIKEAWKNTLEDTTFPDRNQLIDDFRPAYDDLARTVPDLPSFGALVERLLHAIRQTRVEEVNARQGSTPQIDWRAAYPYILVGGQAMDRGFTVEGLTVTYMPRNVGVGNADTVQQRARFFGYKQDYLGYCRVYLENGVRTAYRLYVQHEEDLRQRLAEHRDTGTSLTEWKRAFFLTNALRPTRQNVLQLTYVQDVLNDQWYSPSAPHHEPDAIPDNQHIATDFLRQLTMAEDAGDNRRTTDQKHEVAENVPLRTAYEELLVPLRVTHPGDSAHYTGMLLQIKDYLERHPAATCTVYHMTAGRARERSVNDENEIPTLFQGANYADPAHRDSIYPGDSHIRSAQGLTIQLHNLTVRAKGRGQVISDNTLAVAVWVPSAMAREWLVQDQP